MYFCYYAKIIVDKKKKNTNIKERYAVAVYKDATVFGHVSYNLAPRFSQFLLRDVSKAFAEVTGQKVNRGAGYGLEVPCIYIYIQGMSLLRSLIPFRLSHLLETSAYV